MAPKVNAETKSSVNNIINRYYFTIYNEATIQSINGTKTLNNIEIECGSTVQQIDKFRKLPERI
jgi:hypothetical protein